MFVGAGIRRAFVKTHHDVRSQRALDLNPRYVLGRSWYAVFYLQWARGEFEQGIAEARRARDDDPLVSYLAMKYQYTGEPLDGMKRSNIRRRLAAILSLSR